MRQSSAYLVGVEAPTWLDRELASGASGAARDAGFGREVRDAWAGRRQWLVEGVIARRLDLESGAHALVERSRVFTLVPWRDVLERQVGKAASGIMRADGISLQFGRGRSGPTIS